MSFRVNTNVTALNALRNVSNTGMEFGKAITKLSTGLRINSAADDPAGLIISEKFRAQIGGLSQAIQNSNQAINYAKTAEGAFSEVNTLLSDARTLAVASANSGTLTTAQSQANQSQLTSIAASITRIAQTTQYGTKKLLDGSSGVSSSVTLGNSIGSLNITGTFNGTALLNNSTVTLTSLTAATQAGLTSATFTFATSTVGAAGSFTLNGTTFTTSANTTAQDLIVDINQHSSQTGVVASYQGTNISFSSTAYGTNAKITLTDANGVVRSGGAGSSASAGTDAIATVSIAGSAVLFTGSKGGRDGLTLADADSNSFSLTSLGNVTSSTPAAIGQIVIGSASFQIGAFAGQSASLSLGNYASSQLGAGKVAGLNFSNLDLTTQSGASNAITVIDQAIEDITSARGTIGNFQRNVLESNVRSLGIAKENLTASESSIRDADIAEEMTQYSKLQILQQAGMSVLAQANSAPQAVLSLLR